MKRSKYLETLSSLELNEYHKNNMSDADFIKVIIIIVIISFLIATFLSYKFKKNKDIQIRNDILKILEHLGASDSSNGKYYGIESDYVYLVKNKELKNYIQSREVLSASGYVYSDSFNGESVIIYLNPYLEGLELVNSTGSYLGVNNPEVDEYMDIYYIDKEVPVNKVPILEYAKMLESFEE